MGQTACVLDVMEGLDEYGLMVVAWVRETRAAQGLPPKITDAQTIANVALLLTSGRASDAPMRRYSRRIKRIPAAGRRGDSGVVHEGGHDGPLPGEGQAAPVLTQSLRVDDEVGENG